MLHSESNMLLVTGGRQTKYQVFKRLERLPGIQWQSATSRAVLDPTVQQHPLCIGCCGIVYDSVSPAHRVRRKTVVDVLRESHPLIVRVRMVRHASGVLHTFANKSKPRMFSSLRL